MTVGVASYVASGCLGSSETRDGSIGGYSSGGGGDHDSELENIDHMFAELAQDNGGGLI